MSPRMGRAKLPDATRPSVKRALADPPLEGPHDPRCPASSAGPRGRVEDDRGGTSNPWSSHPHFGPEPESGNLLRIPDGCRRATAPDRIPLAERHTSLLVGEPEGQRQVGLHRWVCREASLRSRHPQQDRGIPRTGWCEGRCPWTCPRGESRMHPHEDVSMFGNRVRSVPPQCGWLEMRF